MRGAYWTATVWLGATLLLYAGTVAAQAPPAPLPFGLSNIGLAAEDHSAVQRLLSEGNFRAIQRLLQARRHDDIREAAPLLRSLGVVSFRAGDYGAAVEAFEKADQLSPLPANDRFSLAMAYVVLKQPAAARRELDKLILEDPKTSLYPYWLARLDYDAQRFRDAVEKLQRIVQSDPEFVRAHDRLGLCFEAMADYDRAREAFLTAIRLNAQRPQPSAWPPLNFGTMLRRIDRLDEAEPYLREAARHAPRLAEARYQLGSLLEAKGELELAAAQFLEATRLATKEPKAHYAIARVYRKLGRTEQAVRSLEKFRELKRFRPD